MAKTEKAEWDFTKYLKARGETLSVKDNISPFHKVTLEEFIDMTFTDAYKDANLKTKTNPRGSSGFLTLLEGYVNNELADQYLNDAGKIVGFNQEQAATIYRKFEQLPAHEFFNNGEFSTFAQYLKDNKLGSSGLFKQVEVGINQFNETAVNLDITEVKNLIKVLDNPRQSRVLPFFQPNILDKVRIGKGFDNYLQAIDNDIFNSQEIINTKGSTKKEIKEAKTLKSIATAAKAKFLLMATTGFRTGEASSLRPFFVDATTDINGVETSGPELAYQNTHYSTFQQRYDNATDSYRYFVFVPETVTKTSTQLFVEIPEFAGKALVESTLQAQELKSDSIFAYKDYTTGKVHDAYSYKTRVMNRRIDDYLFGSTSKLPATGYNIDLKQMSQSGIKAHDMRRFFSTYSRNFIKSLNDNQLSQFGVTKADLNEAADIFQGRRTYLLPAEVTYGSVLSPYTGTASTGMLARLMQDNLFSPSSNKVLALLSNKKPLLLADKLTFNGTNLIPQNENINTEATNNALLSSPTEEVDVIDKSPQTIKELRDSVINNIDDANARTNFLNQTLSDSSISFEEAKKMHDELIQDSTFRTGQGSGVPLEVETDESPKKLKITDQMGDIFGKVKKPLAAAGAVIASTGVAKAFPFLGPAAGAYSSAEIMSRPDEEFEVDSFLSPEALRKAKATAGLVEGVSPIPLDLTLLNLLPENIRGKNDFKPFNELVFPTKSEIEKQQTLENEQDSTLEEEESGSGQVSTTTEQQMNQLF